MDLTITAFLYSASHASVPLFSLAHVLAVSYSAQSHPYFSFIIFESAKYFLKYFAEVYEKETRENAGAKYPKFHTTKAAIMVQTIQDGDVSYKSRSLTLANMVCSGSGCIL